LPNDFQNTCCEIKVDLGDEVDGAALDEDDLAAHVVGERRRPIVRHGPHRLARRAVPARERLPIQKNNSIRGRLAYHQPPAERICIELVASGHNLKTAREGSTNTIFPRTLLVNKGRPVVRHRPHRLTHRAKSAEEKKFR